MQNVFHINEKETLKTRRFANSHARVAKRQFRAAYQNRKIRFVRPRSGDTNSAEPKKTSYYRIFQPMGTDISLNI